MLFQKGNFSDTCNTQNWIWKALIKMRGERDWKQRINKSTSKQLFRPPTISSIPFVYFAVLTNYMKELSSLKIMNTTVNAVTALQTKDSFKQSKSDTASNASFCNVHVAILRRPRSSLAIAVLHRVTVAHNTLSLQVHSSLDTSL